MGGCVWAGGFGDALGCYLGYLESDRSTARYQNRDGKRQGCVSRTHTLVAESGDVFRRYNASIRYTLRNGRRALGL